MTAKAVKKLDVNERPNTAYCVPLSIRDLHIRGNTKRVARRFTPEDLKDEPIAIVGFGPSLKKTWPEIRRFRNIFTCSGSHKYLLDQGCDPIEFKRWLHLDVDPREHKVPLLGTPQPGIEYLPASCVHPTYIDLLLKHDCSVKLWHIFAKDGESHAVLPKGEWQISGGTDAGMRCMTLARVLGYKEMHIFGMDGSYEPEEGSHADEHPNSPVKWKSVTEYEGKTYYTTPGMLGSAQQVFHELDQLKDVDAKFYGTGLIQAMAEKYVRQSGGELRLAFNDEPLISDEMREQNRLLHEQNVYYGAGGGKYADVVLRILKGVKNEDGSPPTVCDYGAGKRMLAKALPFPIYEYDPAVPEISELPPPADVVVSSDVLEHIERDKLDAVLDDLRRVTKQIGYFVIHTGEAVKTYPNGTNTHILQEDEKWWTKQLSRYFTIAKCVQKGKELHYVVSPKLKPQPPITTVGDAKFFTPTETAKWRAKTLLTKEPVTIEWLDKMKPKEVLYDVGANVGGYSVYAGLRGVEVYSFEPEAENFAILTKNLNLNGLQANGFCMALSDQTAFAPLHLTPGEGGGSCHSFKESVYFDLTKRNGNHPMQGCFGMKMDDLPLKKPDHIKIDVDGLEHLVVKGGMDTISGVKSLLIEVNPALPAHLEMIDLLQQNGFIFDAEQVRASTRAKGPFKGVAEHVFYRIDDHVVSAIEKAELIQEPFPHFVVQDVFPKTYFENIPGGTYRKIANVRPLKGYPQRYVSDKKFPAVQSPRIRQAMLDKFGVTDKGFKDETLLIKDKKGYAIGPHTDSPARVLSAIVYLGTGKGLGTSLYVPKEEGFTCKGGPHHKFEDFKKVKTVPYEANTAFVFLKTTNSFHGVEPTSREREVLLYDIRR